MAALTFEQWRASNAAQGREYDNATERNAYSNYLTSAGGLPTTPTTPTTVNTTPLPTPTPTPAPAPAPAPAPNPATNNVSLSAYQQGQVTNPNLPNNTTLTPVLQQVQGNELLQGQSSQVNATGANAPQLPQATPQNIQQTNAQAGQVNASDVTNQLNPNGSTYTANTLGNNAPQAVAQQMTVDPLSTMQGQLAELYNSITPGSPTPAWAQGALTLANEQMAARGMGKSSIGAAAMVAAVQNSAIQIAAQDAATYFQADLANLNNRQQTSLANLQSKQQSMLSDQAALNAAEQFNATSAQQMQQFMSSLTQNILTQNADRVTAISQFNAGQANAIATTNASNALQAQEFNIQQKSAIEQFNSSLQNQREQFNATNAFAIEQSNVTWRRNINTANTAAVNAANQVNVQNAFSLSSTALNNIWQQFRDEASWIFQANQNQNTINANIAMASNNQAFIENQQSSAANLQFLAQIGDFAGKLLVGL